MMEKGVSVLIEIYELLKGQRVMLERRENRIFARQSQGISYGSEIVLAEHVKEYLGGCVYKNSLFFLYINEQGEAVLRNIYDTIVYCQIPILKDIGMDVFEGIGGLQVTFGKLVLYFIEKKDDEKYEVRLYFPFERELDQRIGEDCDLGQLLELQSAMKQKEDGFQKQLEKREQEIKRLKAMIESAKSQYNELMDVATKYRDEAVKWQSKFR